MSKKLRWTLFFSLIGIAAMIYGLGALWDTSNKLGLPALAPSTWPKNTHLQRDPNFPTFVMFVLSQCACSEASVSELNQILTKINSKLNVIIVFVTSKNTTLWSEAKLIPGAQIILDEGGLEADRFGARTSGQGLLYDKQGHLVFSGGITSARGRLGENPGKSAVISFMNEHRLDHQTAPVFGCLLKE